MNKYLILMWIVIVGGALFVLQHYVKAPTAAVDNADEKDQKPIIEEITESTDLEKLTLDYLEKNQPQQAAEVLAQAIEEEPNSETIGLLTVRVQLANLQIEQAKETILKLDESKPEIAYYKGIILILYKQFDQAKPLLSKVETDQAKNLLSAFESYSYYKESEPEFLQLLLAKALVDNGEYYSAIPLLFDILNKKSNYRDAWITLGYAYLNIGNIKESIDALKKAQDLDAEKAETLFFLGLAYAADRQTEQAITTLKAASKAGFEPKELIDSKLKNLNAEDQKVSRQAQRIFYETNIQSP